MTVDRDTQRKNEHRRILIQNGQAKEFQKKTREEISEEVDNSYFDEQ